MIGKRCRLRLCRLDCVAWRGNVRAADEAIDTGFLMADQTLKYRRLRARAILKTFGIVEDTTKRGKGSERMFAGIVDGKITRLPTKCHNEGDQKPVGVIKSIRRHFKLTEADGVTDKEFYGRA
jgi:hypothetical protein